MTYLTSALVGIAAAVAASVIWIVATLVLPMAAPFLVSRTFGAGGGGGTVGSGSILIAAIIGFISGFYWQFRRASTPPSRP